MMILPSKAHLYRTLSGLYTVLTFRNLHIVESRHSEGLVCNMNFHNAVLTEVSKEYTKLNDAFNGKNDEYFNAIEDGIKFCLSYFRQWKDPVKLRERCNCTVPEYILRGKFRAICTNEEKLTENNMMECNIDIRNRYYTLICREIITDSKLQA